MIKRRKMNTIVNITGITLKCLGASDESAIKKAKKKEYGKQQYLKNKEKIKKLSNQWYLKNKEKRKETNKQWYLKNKEEKYKYNKQWYLKNKERKKELGNQWYLKNKEKRNNDSREWSLKNKERKKELNKQWYLKNKKHIRERNKKRRKTDITYKLITNLRRRTTLALKGNKKSTNTMILLGVPNLEFLWTHLESTFKPGMTRENHGLWHIDHIIPCASFDLSKPEEQIKCFHYTNLQALWAHENLSKSDKITTIS
jgi:hypothetical protein